MHRLFFLKSTTFNRRHCLFSVLLLMAVGINAMQNSVDADDWSQWRGPNRTDRSAETGLLDNWGEGGPAKIWHSEKAGLGYAGIAVVGDRLFTLGLDGENEFAICLNASTGEETWRKSIGEQFKNNWGDGPRSTPTVDGEHVYCLTAQGVLACLKIADGEIVWSTEMKKFGGKVPFWGYSESPLVDRDRVFCTPGGKQGAVIGFDKKSGEKVWQSADLTDPAHYSSIIAADVNGQRQLIQLLVSKVVGLDPRDGRLLWTYDWSGRTAVIPTPIFKDGTVYVTSGYGVGSAAIKIGEDNKVQQLFNNKVMKNHHGGVVEVGGHIYGYSDKVGFVCQSLAEGEKVWGDKKSVGKGAVAWADDRFYYVQEDDGQVLLLQADPEGLTVAGSFKLSPQTKRRSPQGRVWVHPVISNGRLYLRDQEYVYCFNVKSGT